ncbi:MAG TPA: serine hydrolase [Plantibacter sp.]|uniref:serine hydrolase n=1 Tax=Plantibacter sp. TaxID=1871045 RepID=UPI002BB40A1F|nr:serine hydrolase [Plantibacter sp.]
MTRSLTIDDLARLVTPTDTAISPDGELVVFTRSEVQDGKTTTSLWSVRAGSPARRMTTGPGDSSPRFSPDGRSLGFLRVIDGAPQLHRLDLDGGEPVRLTSASALPLGAGAAAWSPDGTRIAFTAPVTRSTGADPDAPIVTDRLGYKVDGVGWLGDKRMHLFVVDSDGGQPVRRLTDGDWNAGEPAWSTDGTGLAFTADLEPDGDLNNVSRAYRIVVDDPIIAPTLVGSATFIGGPLLRLDDDALVAVGSGELRVGNSDLIRLGDDPDEPDVALTAELDRNVMLGGPGYPGGRPGLSHRGDGTAEVVFCVRERGWTHLHAIGADGSGRRPIIANEDEVVSALSVARDARSAAVVITSQTSFGEVAVVDLDTAEVTVLTSLTADALPDITVLAAEQRQFPISDGSTVHGWLLSSPDTEGPAPLLLDIHGGPHNSWTGVADSAHLYHQVLAAAGWRILTLNPRGSDGYGEEFMRAVIGGWGTADGPDFHEPLDALIAEGLVDADRLAVTGYSYGGFSTAHLTAHSDRFASAVAGGLVCDFTAVAGASDAGGYLAKISVGGTVVDDAERFLAASPISSVGNVTTPTLILHGAEDQRCPLNQAEQWFSALRSQEVPVRLVAYPGATHAFVVTGSLRQRMDYNRRVIDWVQRYTPAVPARSSGSARAALDTAAWQAELDVLRDRYGVTGAQFGIVELTADGHPLTRTTVASGVLNAATGAPASVDALFQIGSITKVWTTTLIMQLVDDGLLRLEDTVRSVLPDFALGDEETAAKVTIRSLLSHRSGIDGDLFTNTGRGDDCIELYVATLKTAQQVHPLDDGFSYCNSGFVILGRIVEVLRDGQYDAILRERLIQPLGLEHTVTLLEDVPRFAAAAGHRPDGAPAPVWPITRSMGAAGNIVASIGDLLTFAELGLRLGETADGTRILSRESAVLMQREQIDLTDIYPSLTGWGLGWFLEEWSGASVYGHDGGTIGQRAYLRVFPEQQLAIALLTTGGRPDGLYHDLFESAASTVAGLHAPAGASPIDRDEVPAEAALGTFGTSGIGIEIRATEEHLEMVVTERVKVLPDEPEPEAAAASADTASAVALPNADGGTSEPRSGAADGDASEESTAEESTTDPTPTPANVVKLLPSSLPGVWVMRAPGSAGWAQVRPHRGGAYVGLRFLPREARDEVEV